MLREPPSPVRPLYPPPRRRGVRRWRDEFRQAARGVKLGMRGHSSFSVHFFGAALVGALVFARRFAELTGRWG